MPAAATPKPVYALVGDEPFLQIEALSSILERMPPGTDRRDVDGERAGLADVLDDLRSFAMFGGSKVVVVRDADEFITRFRPQLEEYVAAPSESATLIFRCRSLPATQRIHKIIAKTGQIVPCDAPKQKDLAGWVVRRGAAVHALKVAPDAAALLADLIGPDLGRIDSELAKLALMIDGDRVTPEHVTAAGVAFQREQEMWRLTDTLNSGDVHAALRRWRQLCQTDPAAEYKAITWLTLWLQRLTRARQMRQAGVAPYTIAKDMKIWPNDAVHGVLRIADRLGDAGLRSAVERLARADARTKTGLGDAADNVEGFLLSLAR